MDMYEFKTVYGLNLSTHRELHDAADRARSRATLDDYGACGWQLATHIPARSEHESVTVFQRKVAPAAVRAEPRVPAWLPYSAGVAAATVH